MRRRAVGGHDVLVAIKLARLESRLGMLVRQLERRYRADQPRAPRGTAEGGQWVDDTVRVAAGAPRCQGVGKGGCQNGGTFGSSGMFVIDGKPRCWDCAVKYLGIQDLPRREQIETLRLFDPESQE